MRVGILLWAWLFCVNAFAEEIKLFSEPLKPLALTLTANFGLINTPDQSGAEIGRDDLGTGMAEPRYFRSPGTLVYANDAGQEVSLAVDVEPRGMRRRQYCEYKPLDVKLRQDPTDELFRHASKSLELITHCRGDEYLADVFKEYFAYRLKSAFFSPSFRVRLAKITYVDTSGRYPTITKPAVFLESKRDMARRFGARPLKLTDEEEAIPLTESELSEAAWADRYGTSYINKIAWRIRLYKKYLNLKPQIPLSLRDLVLHEIGASLVHNSDVSEEWLINTFPVQFANGAVKLVDYDFDTAGFQAGFNRRSLETAFSEYLAAINIPTLAEYSTRRSAEEKAADRTMILQALRDALNGYSSSNLAEELRGFQAQEFSTSWVQSAADRTAAELQWILDNPEEALAFLSPRESN